MFHDSVWKNSRSDSRDWYISKKESVSWVAPPDWLTAKLGSDAVAWTAPFEAFFPDYKSDDENSPPKTKPAPKDSGFKSGRRSRRNSIDGSDISRSNSPAGMEMGSSSGSPFGSGGTEPLSFARTRAGHGGSAVRVVQVRIG